MTTKKPAAKKPAAKPPGKKKPASKKKQGELVGFERPTNEALDGHCADYLEATMEMSLWKEKQKLAKANAFDEMRKCRKSLEENIHGHAVYTYFDGEQRVDMTLKKDESIVFHKVKRTKKKKSDSEENAPSDIG